MKQLRGLYAQTFFTFRTALVYNYNFRFSLHLCTSRDGLVIDAFAVDYRQFAFMLYTPIHVCSLHTFCRFSI